MPELLAGAAIAVIALLGGLQIGYRLARGMSPLPDVSGGGAWTNLRAMVARTPPDPGDRTPDSNPAQPHKF